MTEFQGFPKIPRFNRDIVITEKIDGTNGCIYFADDMQPITLKSGRVVPFLVGSRNRWIFPENDNHGFAKWAYSQDLTEMQKLGPGHHYGEWWGQGIQRTYGLKEKRFSLFNTSRWTPDNCPANMFVVPVLYKGGWSYEMYDDYAVTNTLFMLREAGSYAAYGFMKPEGIVIFHTASNHMYKITLENDEKPKGAK